MNDTQPYRDLGPAWLQRETDRIRQRHFQLGRHLPVDMRALLDRAARAARESRAARGTPSALSA